MFIMNNEFSTSMPLKKLWLLISWFDVRRGPGKVSRQFVSGGESRRQHPNPVHYNRY
jgi:hypothetical protein